MMDPEQRFLQARQARLSSSVSSSTSATQTALATFWSQLRLVLGDWKKRLDGIRTISSASSTSSSSALSMDNHRQELQALKEELYQLRQHCLHHGGSNGLLIIKVPIMDDLPLADWRLLHAEFTNCFTLWQQVHDQVVPKGKFTFQRYRAELARRQALGIPLSEVSATTTFETTTTTNEQNHQDDGGTLQNIVHSTVCIQEDGTVEIEEQRKNDNSTAPVTTTLSCTSALLLLRNIQNCTITINKSLQALHIVHAKFCTIKVNPAIASSIHITNCQDCQIQASACQQLRIHATKKLEIQVEVLKAGAILEDSTNITFLVHVDDAIEVKDFNWLRAGIPSPNFQITQVTEEVNKDATGSPGEGATMAANVSEVGAASTSNSAATFEKAPSISASDNVTAVATTIEGAGGDGDDDDEL